MHSPQETLCTASTCETGTSNALGDKQLVADVAADRWVAGLVLFPAVFVRFQQFWCCGNAASRLCTLQVLGCKACRTARGWAPERSTAACGDWANNEPIVHCRLALPLPPSRRSCVFDALRACGAVELASSEEAPSDHDLGGSGCGVASPLRSCIPGMWPCTQEQLRCRAWHVLICLLRSTAALLPSP